jgi:hypothetical protein
LTTRGLNHLHRESTGSSIVAESLPLLDPADRIAPLISTADIHLRPLSAGRKW